ncbi:unnamed protein product [Gongylonema pulchrum]|uniref:Gustatory receptor n=1 Tax=Gongylonema pulchrum TaxID=637853 RepID=A0A183DQC9_9BILA|nr:unnamed protein product [Gongylonema pulchrum]
MHKNLQSLNECTMREISSQQEPEDVLVRQHSIIPNLPLAAQILIEAYITFMTQSSLMICAIFFVVFCNVIRQSFNKLIADMQWLGIDLAAMISPKAALEVLRKLQQRFQHLKEAADVVDGQFSVALLYLCAWTLLALCFILYSYLKDSDIQATALQIVVLNGEVLKLCLKMFENHIYDENNASLTNCILMFAETVKMGPANFTAGGFFVITRSLLLTMASFTATYLIILLQSTTNVVCQLPAEFVSQYETPRTTVGPLDT